QKDEKFQKALKIFKAGQFMEKVKKASEKTGINPFAEPQNLITEEKQRLAKENITKAKNRENELVRAVNKAKKEYEDLIAAGEKALKLKNKEIEDKEREKQKLQEGGIEELNKQKTIYGNAERELKQSLAKSEEELNETKKQKERLEQTKSELQAQIQTLIQEKEVLIRNYNEVSRTKNQLERIALETAERINLKNWKEKCQELDKLNEAQKGIIAANTISLKEINNKLFEVEENYKKIYTMLEETRSDLEQQIKQLQTELSSTKIDLESANRTIERKDQEISRLTEIKKERDELAEEKIRLRDQIEVNQTESNKRDRLLDDNAETIKSLGEENKKLITEKEQLENQKAENEGNISQLTAEKSTLQTEKETLEGQLRERDNQLEQAIKQKRLERNQIKELRTQLQETRTELLLAKDQIRNSGEKSGEVKSLPTISKQTDSGKKRKEVTKLIICDINHEVELEKELNLNDFTNLKELYYISNCSNLIELDCENNLLTNITLPTNPNNLKELYLEMEDIEQKIKSTKEFIIVSLVNIDKLPRSLEKISYLTDKKSDCKLIMITPQLEKCRYEFLAEVANTKLVDSLVGGIAKCYGISQDPETKNYMIISRYEEGGNLRECLKGYKASFENRVGRLLDIAKGLENIHQQNLVHYDLHSGNILNNYGGSLITDLGLSRVANSQKGDDEIIGVLPYIAPEVLYETELILRIIDGLRPNLDNISIPKLLKNLIKKYEKNTLFYQQYKEIETKYNQLIQNSTYKIHPNAVLTSKAINTKEFTTRSLQTSRLYQDSRQNDLIINDNFISLESSNISTEQKQTDQELATTTKRQLSIIVEEQEYQAEPMKLNRSSN
ncbi:7086_t:CDS:10, partial [Gigaspora margarita]